MANSLIDSLQEVESPLALDFLSILAVIKKDNDAEPLFTDVLASYEKNLSELQVNIEVNSIVQFGNTLNVLANLRKNIFVLSNLAGHLSDTATDEETRNLWSTRNQALLASLNCFHSNESVKSYVISLLRYTTKHEVPHQLKHRLSLIVEEFSKQGLLSDDKGKTLLEQGSMRLNDLRLELQTSTSGFCADFQLIVQKEALKGLDEHTLRYLRIASEQDTESYALSLQPFVYFTCLRHLENREIRKQLYEAHMRKDVSTSENHTRLVQELLNLRTDFAIKQGYSCFADYKLSGCMLSSSTTALDFLDKVRQALKPAFERDDLKAKWYAQNVLGLEEISPWDFLYIHQKMESERFGQNETALKPYFCLNNVLNGVFEILHKVFGLKVEGSTNSQSGQTPLLFEVYDEQENHIGSFIADLYSRPSKKRGSWVRSIIARHGAQPGLSTLCLNLMPSDRGEETLLTHEEVVVLFHEFGHLLHALLCHTEFDDTDWRTLPHDFKEFPARLFERWAWEEEALRLFARHYRTGESMPSELYTLLLSKRHFMASHFKMDNVAYATLDLEFHSGQRFPDSKSILDLYNQVIHDHLLSDVDDIAIGDVIPVLTSSYSAELYAYIWSETLAAKAFQQFKASGIFDRDSGKILAHKVLAKGNYTSPNKQFASLFGPESEGAVIDIQANLEAWCDEIAIAPKLDMSEKGGQDSYFLIANK